jgi:hypothetical protein
MTYVAISSQLEDIRRKPGVFPSLQPVINLGHRGSAGVRPIATAGVSFRRSSSSLARNRITADIPFSGVMADIPGLRRLTDDRGPSRNGQTTEPHVAVLLQHHFRAPNQASLEFSRRSSPGPDWGRSFFIAPAIKRILRKASERQNQATDRFPEGLTRARIHSAAGTALLAILTDYHLPEDGTSNSSAELDPAASVQDGGNSTNNTTMRKGVEPFTPPTAVELNQLVPV